MADYFFCACGAMVAKPADASALRCPRCQALLAYAEPASIADPPTDPAEPLAPDAPAPASVFVGPSPPGRRRRQRRPASRQRPNNPAQLVIEWWRPWLDPVICLWLPILAPAGAMLTFLLLAGVLAYLNGSSGLWVVGLGVGIGTIPLGYVCFHLDEILARWAFGDRRDPDWPDPELGEILTHGFRWLCCLLYSLGLGWLITQGAIFFGAAEGTRVLIVLNYGLWLLLPTYFFVALLAATLGTQFWAGHPFVVMPAIARLNVRLVPFWAELVLHGLLYYGQWRLLWAAFDRSIYHALLAWVLCWLISLLAMSRLLRVLGSTYHAHADRIGWFRVGPVPSRDTIDTIAT